MSELNQLISFSEQGKETALQQGTRTPVKDWFLIVLASETGLRVQEMADLSCGDLQIESGRASVIVRNGKGGKKRVVHVREEFRQKAAEYLKWKRAMGDLVDHEKPVFCVNNRRMSKRALQKSYQRSIEKAGIQQVKGVGIHSLRHTYATFLLRASNFNLRLVQRQLGHESAVTTEVYTHVLALDVQSALKHLYGGAET